MKKPEDLAKKLLLTSPEDAKKAASHAKRVSGALRNHAKDGDRYGLSHKEVETLHAAAGLMDRIADLEIKAAEIKRRDQQKLDEREKLIASMIAKEFAGDGSVEHQVLFIGAVRSYCLNQGQVKSVDDLPQYVAEAVDGLAYQLARKEGSPQVVVADAWKLFTENRGELLKRFGVHVQRLTAAEA